MKRVPSLNPGRTISNSTTIMSTYPTHPYLFGGQSALWNPSVWLYLTHVFPFTEQSHLKAITTGRFGNFVGGHYASHNLSSVLYLASTDASSAVRMEVYSPPAGTKPPFEKAIKQTFSPVKKGQSFGPSWSNHWFKIAITVPKEWHTFERVQCNIPSTCRLEWMCD